MKCIKEIKGKSYLIDTILGKPVKVEISADIAEALKSVGIQLCND
ncbi:hypothetical protein [Peribacillus huizhouensis]|uniref:Uncharacterized protein n=1 Tax=Peribacillus huizhouensis TaxID=1501239 RepID=A0ABR6CMW1_9BACI|nr:hypothetical protein [Peribacillus huizhouensis]MBA9026330.1 hypothetical protein [Peribacillus huizhouensis]